MNYYFVYKTTHNPSGKVYIGYHSQSESLEFDGYFGSGRKIKNAVNRHGFSEFTREILEIVVETTEPLTMQDLVDTVHPRETFWIKHFKQLLGKGMMYNINTDGAFGGATTTGRRWSTNGVLDLYLEPNDVLPVGYWYGRTNCVFHDISLQKELSARMRDKHSSDVRSDLMKIAWAQGRHRKVGKGTNPKVLGDKNSSKRPEVREKISKKHLGKLCYNDGTRNYFILAGETVPDGYVRGRVRVDNK